jgi:hypothetical protein
VLKDLYPASQQLYMITSLQLYWEFSLEWQQH